ncbi:MAG: aldo/keto reductase family protein [Candidatus Obscuribacterales bacterium]|nr:aldo/keto reductase family protein [Candidatus Obscuribacterales bacterium]
MEYRKLGKWGARVSEVSLGSWLTYGGSVDEASSIAQIHHAYERGVNFFDTANVYAQGKAELVVGKAISTLRRDDIFLATKVFFNMGNGPNDKGLSRKHVFEQCHASLKRLNVDYIDLYQCHRFDPDTPLVELVLTMDILTRQGKILYWGVSEWPAAKIQEVVDVAHKLNAPPPVSNQPCYNMLTRDIEKEVLPVSESNGMGQVVFSPLAQGVLTGKYKAGEAYPADSRAANPRDGVFLRGRGLLESKTLQAVELLAGLAHENGMTIGQMALSWCLRLPGVSSVIVGATKPEQLNENIQAAGIKLSSDLLVKIDSILAEI